jgi:arginine/lysine/ornithine decarboxylase
MDETKLAEAIVNALNAADNNRAEAAKTAEEIRARQKNIESLIKFTKDLKESSSASKVLGNILKEQRQEYKKVEDQLDELAQAYQRANTWEERKIILEREREVKRSQAASMDERRRKRQTTAPQNQADNQRHR